MGGAAQCGTVSIQTRLWSHALTMHLGVVRIMHEPTVEVVGHIPDSLTEVLLPLLTYGNGGHQ